MASDRANKSTFSEDERKSISPTRRYRQWREDNAEDPPEPLEEWVKPHKAYKNADFLASKDARMIRIFCEMEESHCRLEREGVENVIMVFGSARAMLSCIYLGVRRDFCLTV